MNQSIAKRADAAFQEQVNAQWRDWRTYLRAHLTLLEARSVEQNVFERDANTERQNTDAQQQLDLLPAAQRAMFDGIRETRRQQEQVAAESEAARLNGRGRVPDSDTVERLTCTALLAEAEGTVSDGRSPGWGDVPLLVDSAVQWYRVNTITLRDAPTAAAYGAGRTEADDLRRRVVLAIGLGAATLIFVLGWFLWPRTPRQATASGALVTVNATPTAVWTISSAQVLVADGEPIVLPLTAATSWTASDTTGGWHSAQALPLRICLPVALFKRAVSVVLRSDEGPERTYLLSAARAPTNDLLVEPCSGSGTARYGALQQIGSAPSERVGTTQTLNDNRRIAVTSIEILGPGQDGSLALATARVVVTVAAPQLDWPTYAPTLVLASGERIQTPEIVAKGDRVELRYLVPLPTSDLELAWSVTEPGQQTLRWRATLSPPLDRAATLRDALTTELPTLARTERGLRLTVVVRNRGNVPLALTREDLSFARSAGAPLVLDVDGLQQPLGPDEARTLTVNVSAADLIAPLTLTIGGARYQITR